MFSKKSHFEFFEDWNVTGPGAKYHGNYVGTKGKYFSNVWDTAKSSFWKHHMRRGT